MSGDQAAGAVNIPVCPRSTAATAKARALGLTLESFVHPLLLLTLLVLCLLQKSKEVERLGLLALLLKLLLTLLVLCLLHQPAKKDRGLCFSIRLVRTSIDRSNDFRRLVQLTIPTAL